MRHGSWGNGKTQNKLIRKHNALAGNDVNTTFALLFS